MEEPTSSNTAASSTKWRLLVVAVCVFVMLLIAVATLLSRAKTDSPAEVQQQLNKSLQTSLGRSDGLDVSYEPKSGLASIVQLDSSSHEGPSAQSVRTGYVLLVKLGRGMFTNPNIKSIEVTEKTKLELPVDPLYTQVPREIRPKQESNITHVVTIAITKENFQSIDWDKYKGKTIDKLLTEEAYKYTVNPALKSQLSDKDLYLP